MWLHRWLLALAVVLSIAAPSGAAELVMFYRDGCPYCAAWEREVGGVYDRTDIARRAPLRRVNLDRDPANVELRGRVIYTPTFVLADKDREVARIEGYPGHDFFWSLLERLFEQLPARSSREFRTMKLPAMAALQFEGAPKDVLRDISTEVPGHASTEEPQR